ncbi:hypothetical protein BD779DRAFT_1405737, partial [Infundibulicybe gibba]
DQLSCLVFRWLAIPWIQSELDKWVSVQNRSAVRGKETLLHGIPELIRHKPEKFGAIPIPPEVLCHLEDEYAPRHHPVFQLIPAIFTNQAAAFYVNLRCPPVTFDTFWDIYRGVL